MPFHCRLGQGQPGGDLPVAERLLDQRQDLPLAPGERLGCVAVCEARLGDREYHPFGIRQDRTDRHHEFLPLDVHRQVAASARLQRGPDQVRTLAPADDEDA